MTDFWSVAAFLGTLGPLAVLVFLSVRVLIHDSENPARISILPASGVVLLFLISLLFCNPHRDIYTGLDVAMTRLMAQSLAQGQDLNGDDVGYATVPDAVKPDLLYRRALTGPARLTRDGVFQLVAFPETDAVPFFLPILPLAAAGGARLGVSVDAFVPLVAVFWVLAVFVVATAQGGRFGPYAAVALILGTAWPVWFLRGFHAEAVGGVLIAAVIAARTVIRPGWRLHLLFGAMLGLSLAYHLTLIVLVLPVALTLVIKSGRYRDTAALVVGGVGGVSPLLLMHLTVCQPYGDFLNPIVLRAMFQHVPEIRLVLIVGAVGLLVAGVMMGLAHAPSIRNRMGLHPFPKAASADCFIAFALSVMLPFFVGGALKKGALETWGGIGLFAGVVALAVAFLFLRRQLISDRFLFASLCAAGLVFIYIKGVEVPAGIWSQRRFTAVLLSLIVVLAGPLASGFRAVSGRSRLWAGALMAVAIVPVVWHMATGAPAYFLANDAGAPALTQLVSEQIQLVDEPSLTLFDYHPHSIPHQLLPKKRVFGLNEHVGRAYAQGPVMRWLAGERAAGITVQVVSSYTPQRSMIEDGLLLTFGETLKASVAGTTSKTFFPLQRVDRALSNTFYAVDLVTEANWADAVQHVRLGEGPLGLRTPWGKHARGGVWSVTGSGIIGVVPPPGGRIRFELHASWTPPESSWTNQVIVVTPPFVGAPLELTIEAEGEGVVSGELIRDAGDVVDRGWTGVYRLHAQRPYDPAAFGVSGYRPDLGVVVEAVKIAPLGRR